MDIFKKLNNDYATSIDWNCPKVTKRHKNDTHILHQLSRARLKDNLQKELNNNGI